MSVPTVTNGAVGVHHTATVDTPWDGPAAVAAMPNDASVLKYCHAWGDSSKPQDQKGSWKMPHHTKEGGPANLAGCRNGLARLKGSSIPAADKPGVERHLKAHLADGGSDDSDADDRYAPLILGRHQMRNAKPRDWFRIMRNADNGNADSDGDSSKPAQVWIYDEIGGGGFFRSGISASDFVRELADVKASAIDLHINSPGGDVFDAIAIFNALKRHPASVTSYIDGLAASAASFIAQAGSKVIIEPNAQIMVHDALAFCYGNAADMAKVVDLLNKASDNIASIYAAKSGVETSTWRDVMREEAWYSADEAVTAGLASEVGKHDDVPEDAKLTDVERFRPSLAVYRYQRREDAPDPAEVHGTAARGADIRLVGEHGPELTEDLSVVPLDTPAARERAPIPTLPPHVGLAGASVITMPTTPITETVPAVVAAPADPEPIAPVFDAEMFRSAVHAALGKAA